MINMRKLGLVGKVALSAIGFFGLVKLANAGNYDIMNFSTQRGLEKQSVSIVDNQPDGIYVAPWQASAFIAYIKNSSGEKLAVKGIDPLKYEKNKIYLETQNIQEGTPNQFRVQFYDNTGYEDRNVILRQDPNDINANPNIYDLWELTNEGTTTAYINLPPITNPVNGQIYATWDTISTNCADINFDGKVNYLDLGKFGQNWLRSDCNPTNNWCDYADINQDGTVNFIDYSLLASRWAYDSNDPNTYTR